MPIGRYKKPLICDSGNLKNVSSVLRYSKAEIQCVDYRKMLSKADTDDFVYLDPRYDHGSGRSYGGGGRRSFDRGSPAPKPVEVGKEYEVEVTEISRKGDGIARVQGFVVFVNGKVGNKVKVKVTEVADRFAKATLV